ncbi:lipid A export permease/ATP-binding protein MsbA [Oceanospirillum linum]|uniref:lipid A export permease/ATP-binding protein MsbA n=1 Tax=Oceanospirillum linum TaxID=966 RepID=UPI00089E59CE|nr:lipid A export permease/ATP-binding protein MsbA [Oceanospirillum linum]SEF50339.1 ATP-binding cassette, subfamily B, MsbA [Oleiphilus messinensis]SMP03822.1 ATP-binding cassette, subfamily B, MsbA [Oceanospirillum linum]
MSDQKISPFEDSPKSAASSYFRLLKYVKAYSWAFALSILGYIIYAASSTAFAELMKYLVDSIEKQNSEFRWLFPTLMVSAFAARGVGSFLGIYFMEIVARGVVHKLRCQLFDKYLSLPVSYFDSQSSGHLISRLTFNIDQVTNAASQAVTVVIREGIFVFGLLLYLFYNNWRLTLIFIAMTPLIGLVVSVASKRFRKVSRRIQTSMGDVTHVASEAITGYRVVRTFDGTEYERSRFNKASELNRKQFIKMAATRALSTPLVQLIVAFAMGTLVWLALDPEIMQGMTPGEFIAFITAASLMAKPIRQLTEVNNAIQRGVAAAEDLFEQYDKDDEPDYGSGVMSQIKGDVSFRNVGFRYPGTEKQVLKDVNFDVNAGQVVAIVGRSGSGKSTLINLIPRFYEPVEGGICFDGQPLENVTLSSLRRQISMVTQQVTLFNDTVANNIAYGQPGITREQIKAAAKSAYAMSFIEELPDGLDTLVGDNGVLLSGGQRQRLAIARAILKDAPILILDEATSALDTESERYIQKALDEVMKNRTTFVIAHRLSTIENADIIMVMEQGEIIESGSHKELLAKGGAYAQLHSMQFSDEEA